MLDEDAMKEDEEDLENLRYKDLQEIQKKGLNKKEYAEIVAEMRQFITTLAQTRQLDEFRKEMESLLRTLETTYGKVQSDFQLCESRNKEIYEKTMKVRQLQKQVLEDRQRLSTLKVNFVQACNDVDQLRDAEAKMKEQMETLKAEIEEIQKQLDNEFIIPEATKLIEMQAAYENLIKEKADVDDNLNVVTEKMNQINKELEEKQKEIETLSEKIDTKQNEIAKSENESVSLEAQCRLKEDELTRKKEETKNMEENIRKNREDIQAHKERKAKLENDLRKIHNDNEDIQNGIHEKEGEKRTNEDRIKKEEDRREQKAKELEKISSELETLHNENKILAEENEQLIKDITNLKREKSELESRRSELDLLRSEQKSNIEELNKEINKISRNIEFEENNNKNYEKTRNIFNRKLVQEEEKERQQKDLEITSKNQLARLQNEISIYRNENQALQKQHAQLDKEKQKYSSDAIRANMKYIETVEEVKEKEKIKEDFQKRNKELEEKLKNQQKLYECVRSDRNLYSKNLLESQEEIKDLDRKFKMLTNEINQLKEEKTSKDTKLTQINKELSITKTKNLIQSGEKEKTEREISTLTQLFKNQAQNIARKNHIISEAEGERSRQRKDYEMVIGERDILGNQLIKRTDELHLLYEKIKIQQSGLAKGNVKFQQVSGETKILKDEISKRKREISLLFFSAVILNMYNVIYKYYYNI